MPFDQPYYVYGLNRSPGMEQQVHPARDELTVYVSFGQPWFEAHLYVATRASRADPFGRLMPMTALTGPTFELNPSLTDDGLVLFVSSRRPVWEAGTRVYVAKRNTVNEPFPSLDKVVVDGDPGPDYFDPYVLPDGSAMYFMSSAAGNTLRRAALRGTTPDPSVLIPMAMSVRYPVVSADELTLFVSAGGPPDIFVAKRASRDQAFGNLQYVNEVNSTEHGDIPQWISPDGCRLYFTRTLSGSYGNISYSMIAERLRN